MVQIDFNAMLETGWAAFLDWAPRLALAIVLFIAGFWVAGWITSMVSKGMKKRKVDPTLRPFIRSLIRISLRVVVVLIAISALGFQMTSIVAILAAIGFAIGMALQGSLSNFAGGIVILFFKPFKVGDWIEAQGKMGTVHEIQIFNTILKSPDNKTIIMPNGQLSNSVMENWTTEPTRRVDMSFGIGYDDDIDKARRIIESVLAKCKEVLKDPKPDVFLSEHGESSVNFVVRPWCESRDYWKVKFFVVEEIKKAFDKEGISIPYPQRDVHLYKH